jgi:toxin-antitoxin system PIN domain toxin
MIAVDSNVLVYAHREDSAWHAAAYARVAELAEGRSPWAIPWPCVHEFLAIVTHLRIYAPPTPLQAALDQVEAWMESPSLVLLSEPQDYWQEIRDVLQASRVSGSQIHDARIAALCALHGVTELWTADRDFGRFPGIKVRNPLVG